MADAEERDLQAGSEGGGEAEAPAPAPDESAVGNGSPPKAIDFIEQAIREQRAAADPEDALDEEPTEEDAPEDEDEVEGEVDSPEADDSDKDDEEGEAGEEDEDEGDKPPPEAPEAKLQRHLSVLAQSPQRWSEIPAKDRGPAIEALARNAYEQGARQALDYAQGQRTQEGQVREFVTRHDQLRRDDPDAFAEWAEEHPDQLAVYAQGKSYLKGNGSMPQGQQAAAPSAQPNEQLQQVAQAQLNRLFAEGVSTEVRNAVEAKVRTGNYQLTTEGVQRLASDIDTAFRDATAIEQEARARAERRKQAKEKRAKTARPDIGGGRGVTPDDDISQITDVRELLAMGHRQSQQRGRRGAARTTA